MLSTHRKANASLALYRERPDFPTAFRKSHSGVIHNDPLSCQAYTNPRLAEGALPCRPHLRERYGLLYAIEPEIARGFGSIIKDFLPLCGDDAIRSTWRYSRLDQKNPYHPTFWAYWYGRSSPPHQQNAVPIRNNQPAAL